MDVNEVQIGGNHYNKYEYQHWDFVCDTNLHYLIASATKYVARWRDKNGIEDLMKTLHYINKASDLKIEAYILNEDHVTRFCEQLNPWDALLIGNILDNDYELATCNINDMLKDINDGATQSYVNQDR